MSITCLFLLLRSGNNKYRGENTTSLLAYSQAFSLCCFSLIYTLTTLLLLILNSFRGRYLNNGFAFVRKKHPLQKDKEKSIFPAKLVNMLTREPSDVILELENQIWWDERGE